MPAAVEPELYLSPTAATALEAVQDLAESITEDLTYEPGWAERAQTYT